MNIDLNLSAEAKGDRSSHSAQIQWSLGDPTVSPASFCSWISDYVSASANTPNQFWESLLEIRVVSIASLFVSISTSLKLTCPTSGVRRLNVGCRVNR